MITPATAYNIRYERGLYLCPSEEYSHPRLKEIAIEQQKLQDKIVDLDQEILTIYTNWLKHENEKFNPENRR